MLIFQSLIWGRSSIVDFGQKTAIDFWFVSDDFRNADLDQILSAAWACKRKTGVARLLRFCLATQALGTLQTSI